MSKQSHDDRTGAETAFCGRAVLRFGIISIVLAIAATCLATTASAESECSAQDQRSCTWLAVAYSAGMPPFPQDQRRADELVESLFNRQRELCESEDWRACVDMVITTWRHPARASNYEPPTTETMRLAVELAIGTTQAGCDRGDALACLQRSRLYPQLAEPTYAWTEEGARSIDLEKRKFLKEAFLLLGTKAVAWSNECSTGVDAECLKLVNLLITWVDSLRYESKADVPPELVSLLFPPRLIETVALGCVGFDPESCSSLVELAFFLKPGNQRIDRIDLLGAQVHTLEAKCRSEIGAACLILGHLNGSEELARSYLHRACDAGHSEGCLLAGMSDYMAFLQTEQVSDLQMASEAMEFACAESRLLACEFLQNLSRQ